MATTIPSGWSDDGTILRAPNNIPVTNGFRQWVLSHDWNPQNFPLRAAEARSPLEISNPSLGNGTRQVFRMTVLEWTTKTNVFEAWGGQELLAVETASAAINPANLEALISQASTILNQLQAALQAATPPAS